MRAALTRLLFPFAVILAATACVPPEFKMMGLKTKEEYKPLETSIAATMAPEAKNALYCRVSLGTAKFGSKWRTFATQNFYLPPGMRVNVGLKPKSGSGNMPFQAWYSSENQQMMFCPVLDGPPDKKITCTSVYALDDDLALGIKRTFDIPHAIEGGELTCAHSKEHLRK